MLKTLEAQLFETVFEGELITLPEGGAVQKYDDEAFAASASSNAFLPRIQLMTSSSKKCKAGEFPVNCYALVKDSNYLDLGKNVDALVIAWRPKAIEMGDAVIAVYDPKLVDGQPTGEFARIAERSDIKDSGCMFGPEFLLWIPSVKQFATFFLGSKSARREAPALKANLLKAMTLKSKFVEWKGYGWQAPTFTQCSTPFSDLPAQEALAREVEKFNNPPASEIEKVEESTETRER